MHVYLAAVYTNSYLKGQRLYEDFNDFEKNLVDSIVQPHHILESWHYVGKQKFVDEMRANQARIFLDSGAFSAHTLGVELKVSEYCDYIKRNQDILRVEDGIVMASVLDGIGDPLRLGEINTRWNCGACVPFHASTLARMSATSNTMSRTTRISHSAAWSAVPRNSFSSGSIACGINTSLTAVAAPRSKSTDSVLHPYR